MRSAKQKEGILIEHRPGACLPLDVCFFHNRFLVRAAFFAESGGRNVKGRGLRGLQSSTEKALAALGSPTFIGTTGIPGSKLRSVLLLWTTSTQCAYIHFFWDEGKNSSLAIFDLTLVDAPWRSTSMKLKNIWPSSVAPNPDDETQQRQIIALLEEIQPHSTDNIKHLPLAPELDLWKMKKDKLGNIGSRTE